MELLRIFILKLLNVVVHFILFNLLPNFQKYKFVIIYFVVLYYVGKFVLDVLQSESFRKSTKTVFQEVPLTSVLPHHGNFTSDIQGSGVPELLILDSEDPQHISALLDDRHPARYTNFINRKRFQIYFFIFACLYYVNDDFVKSTIPAVVIEPNDPANVWHPQLLPRYKI